MDFERIEHSSHLGIFQEETGVRVVKIHLAVEVNVIIVKSIRLKGPVYYERSGLLLNLHA